MIFQQIMYGSAPRLFMIFFNLISSFVLELIHLIILTDLVNPYFYFLTPQQFLNTSFISPSNGILYLQIFLAFQAGIDSGF